MVFGVGHVCKFVKYGFNGCLWFKQHFGYFVADLLIQLCVFFVARLLKVLLKPKKENSEALHIVIKNPIYEKQNI